MDGVSSWDFNIIVFLNLQCKIVGAEIWQTMHIGGSWVPSLQIFMLRCTWQ